MAQRAFIFWVGDDDGNTNLAALTRSSGTVGCSAVSLP